MGLKLSEEFRRLNENCKGEKLTFRELAKVLDPKMQAVFCLFLSLPFLFFLPLPGLSLVFGLFIFFNGFRIASKQPLWFPSFIKERKISSQMLSKALRFSERWTLRLEKFVRPRGSLFTKHPIFQWVSGMIFCFCGFFLALPLPPGTNFLPGLNVALLSLGILEEDNLAIFCAYVLFCINFFLYLILPLFGLKKIL